MEFELVVNECRPLKAPVLVFHGSAHVRSMFSMAFAGAWGPQTTLKDGSHSLVGCHRQSSKSTYNHIVSTSES